MVSEEKVSAVRQLSRRGSPIWKTLMSTLCWMSCVFMQALSLPLQAEDPIAAKKFVLPDHLEATVWAKAPMFFNPTNFDIDERGRVWVTEAVNYRNFKPESNAGSHMVTDKSDWTLRAGSWYTGGTPYNTENTPGRKSDDGRVYVGGLAMSINPDGSGLSVEAHNFSNNYETCLDSLGNMFQNDNDDQVVSCRTTWLMQYANAGYSSADGQRSWQADQRPGQSIPTAHWHQDDPGVLPFGDLYGAGSPTGMVVYEGDALGEEFRGMLLSCEAGRNVVFGYHARPQGARFDLRRLPFFSSGLPDNPNYKWNQVEQDRRKWFRPSDVAVGPDGTVYVADWFDPIVGGHSMHDRAGAGAIYRIAPKSQTLAVPKIDLNTIDGQIAALASPAPNVRFLGFEKLLAQRENAIPALIALRKANKPMSALAFIENAAAAEAMIEIASQGPSDLHTDAAWWIEFRSNNLWQDYAAIRRYLRKAESAPSEVAGIQLPGLPAYTSEVIGRGDVADIQVDIAGAKRLYLVVTDAGDGNSCDWADWAEPRLVGSHEEVKLTSLKWNQATSGYGQVLIDKNCRDLPLRIDGRAILDAVGSPSVQVYYDTANMEKQGYDIYKEIRQLGRERICEFHCKENGFLLGQGRVDFDRVKNAIDDIGYHGWLVIESAVGKGQGVPESYAHNQKYLRSVFQ
jgi:putative membrane-bound dehydrogenase-like protein